MKFLKVVDSSEPWRGHPLRRSNAAAWNPFPFAVAASVTELVVTFLISHPSEPGLVMTYQNGQTITFGTATGLWLYSPGEDPEEVLQQGAEEGAFGRTRRILIHKVGTTVELEHARTHVQAPDGTRIPLMLTVEDGQLIEIYEVDSITRRVVFPPDLGNHLQLTVDYTQDLL